MPQTQNIFCVPMQFQLGIVTLEANWCTNLVDVVLIGLSDLFLGLCRVSVCGATCQPMKDLHYGAMSEATHICCPWVWPEIKTNNWCTQCRAVISMTFTSLIVIWILPLMIWIQTVTVQLTKCTKPCMSPKMDGTSCPLMGTNTGGTCLLLIAQLSSELTLRTLSMNLKLKPLNPPDVSTFTTFGMGIVWSLNMNLWPNYLLRHSVKPLHTSQPPATKANAHEANTIAMSNQTPSVAEPPTTLQTE